MIKNKEKPCNGTTSSTKGYGCGKLTLHRVYGLGKMCGCYSDWLLNSESGKIKLKKAALKGAEIIKNENKKKDLEKRESLKSIARLIQETRVPFQKWIRLRDANEACISCGTTTAKIWHSGHFKKAELFTGVIFHEMNVNKQCEKCNTFLGGNESEYRIGLVKKYGEKAVIELEELANELRQYSFDRIELKEIKKKYQELLKQ